MNLSPFSGWGWESCVCRLGSLCLVIWVPLNGDRATSLSEDWSLSLSGYGAPVCMVKRTLYEDEGTSFLRKLGLPHVGIRGSSP